MRRLNLGCGSIQPEGWDNADVRYFGQRYAVNILASPDLHEWVRDKALERAIGGEHWTGAGPVQPEPYDYIVANHLLSCFSHHELKDKVLPNLLSMLKPYGVLRILVPDADLAIKAYCNNDTGWFPLGDDLPGIDERLCTFLPWFGESKSIFTYKYLADLLNRAGFGVARAEFGQPSWYKEAHSEIGSLDDRRGEALIVEAIKNGREFQK